MPTPLPPTPFTPNPPPLNTCQQRLELEKKEALLAVERGKQADEGKLMYKEDLRIIQLLNRRNRTSSMLRASAGGGWNALRGSGTNLNTICLYHV
jgi:hypothetical protein